MGKKRGNKYLEVRDYGSELEVMVRVRVGVNDLAWCQIEKIVRFSERR